MTGIRDVLQLQKIIITDVCCDIICTSDAVKTEVLESSVSAEEQQDYSHTSATLWKRDRDGGSSFKTPSCLLPCLNQVSDRRLKICIWAILLPRQQWSSGVTRDCALSVFSPTCLWMTSSVTFSPLRVGSIVPRIINRRLRPVAAENCLAWREGSSLPYLHTYRHKRRQPVNLKEVS